MSERRPRAVILVANTAAPYSRGLRVARSLADAGYGVEIAAVTGDGQPIEERDGAVVTRRYEPSGRWAELAAPPVGPPSLARKVVVRGHRLLGRIVPPLRRFPAPTPDALRKIVFWPFPIRGWWATLRRDLPPADLVTLDRVICCYPDYEGLLHATTRLARRYYVLSFPHDRWYVRAHTAWQNFGRRRKGNPFRTFVHSPGEMRAMIERAGFRPVSWRRSLMWAVELYERRAA